MTKTSTRGCAIALLSLAASASQSHANSPAQLVSPPAAPGYTLDVIATGSRISGANGIHFGPDGLLYVASVVGNQLIVMDPKDGTLVKRFSSKDGVDGPDDVAFAPDGSYYWTSILTGEVAGFRPDGTRVTAAKLTPGVNPLTFSNDGRLFVGQCFFGTGLYEVDATGSKPPRSIRSDLGPSCGMNGMDWGLDGRLYGARWFKGEAVSLNPDTGEMRTEAKVQVPAAVKFDSKGRLYVLDTMAGEVVRVNGKKTEVVAHLSPGLDNLAFDANDHLYVSSYADGFVAEVNADGSLRMLSPGGMSSPGGIAMRGDEVIVADLHALRGFDSATGTPTFTERNVLGVSKLGSSLNVATDGDALILTSWVDNDVRVWNEQAKEVVEQYKDLHEPVAAVRFNGRLIVTEHAAHRVIAVSKEGTYVLAEGLPAPTGLLVDGNDVYLSDRADGTIKRIIADGSTLPAPKIVLSGLNGPEGFARDQDGFVVIEAGSGELARFAANGERTPIARFELGETAAGTQPPSFVFNSVAIASDGSLIVTDEHNRSLLRVTRTVASTPASAP